MSLQNGVIFLTGNNIFETSCKWLAWFFVILEQFEVEKDIIFNILCHSNGLKSKNFCIQLILETDPQIIWRYNFHLYTMACILFTCEELAMIEIQNLDSFPKKFISSKCNPLFSTNHHYNYWVINFKKLVTGYMGRWSWRYFRGRSTRLSRIWHQLPEKSGQIHFHTKVRYLWRRRLHYRGNCSFRNEMRISKNRRIWFFSKLYSTYSLQPSWIWGWPLWFEYFFLKSNLLKSSVFVGTSCHK